MDPVKDMYDSFEEGDEPSFESAAPRTEQQNVASNADPTQQLTKDEVLAQLEEEANFKAREYGEEILVASQMPTDKQTEFIVRYNGSLEDLQKQTNKNGEVNITPDVKDVASHLGVTPETPLVITNFEIVNDRSAFAVPIGVKCNFVKSNIAHISNGQSKRVAHCLEANARSINPVGAPLEPKLTMTAERYDDLLNNTEYDHQEDLRLESNGPGKFYGMVRAGTPMAREFLKLHDTTAWVQEKMKDSQEEMDILREFDAAVTEDKPDLDEWTERVAHPEYDGEFIAVDRSAAEVLATQAKNTFTRSDDKVFQSLKDMKFTLLPLNAKKFNDIGQHMDGYSTLNSKKMAVKDPQSLTFRVRMGVHLPKGE